MKIYIFGYGSLMNKENLKQLEKPELRKLNPVTILNLERILIQYKTFQNFGVKDKIKAKTNGVLIQVTTDEILRLDRREKYYTRKELDKKRILFNYGNKLNFNHTDKVYIYYPNETVYKTTYKKTIQSLKYIKICLLGSIQFGKTFLIDFIKSTRGIKNAYTDILIG
jgi:cation transport regulator ChaC